MEDRNHSVPLPRWLLLLVLCGGIGLLFAGYRLHQQLKHPNVVFLVLDTLRYDHYAAKRNDIAVMPFLTSYAADGANFTNAISPSSWTRPSLASLFTGLYPETHHVEYSGDPTVKEGRNDSLAPGLETMADYLGEAGYDTWGVQTNINGHPSFGFDQGFAPGQYKFIDFMPARIVKNNVLQCMRKAKPPFFLFAHFVDPHSPYTPTSDYKEVFGPQPVPAPQDAPYVDGGDTAFKNYFYDVVNTYIGRQPQMAFPPLTDSGKEALRYRYDAEIRSMDDQLSGMIRTIEGTYPNTIFVIVADHGEEFWERGSMGHSNQVYQESIHVPLIVHGPGVPKREVDSLVTTLGVLPTIAKVAGLPARPQWQAPDLFTQAANPAPVFSWTGGSYDDGLVNVSTIIDGATKLMASLIDPGRPKPTHSDTEVYDLTADPGETKNLYPGNESANAALLEKLKKHREDARAAGENIAKTSAPMATATPESAALKEQLDALGYSKGADAKPNTAPIAPAPQAPTPAPAPPSTAAPPPAAAAEPVKTSSAAGPANVLLVVIDTLRADRIWATRDGIPVMPKLRDIARRVSYFQNAYAQASWTKPSATSILTGLYPQTHGVEFGVQKPWVEGQQMTVQGLAPEKHTILGFLKGHGYHTAAVQTNVHLQGAYGFADGCDDYAYARWAPANEVTDRALAAMRQSGPPFVVYAHYFDPHADYNPPEPHRSVFGEFPPLTPEEEDLLKNDYNQRYYLEKAKVDMGLLSQKTLGTFSEAGREHVRQLYDGECHFVDEELGRLVAKVREEYPNTLIAITADHGEEFWEHGGIGHAKTVYEEVVRVPIVISGPGVPQHNVEIPVQNIDLAPTIAAYLKLPADPNWQGRDILADPLPVLPVFAETHGSFPEAKLHRETIVANRDKLIRDVAKQSTALYDLSRDWTEQKDLSAEAPDKVAALAGALDTHNAEATAHPLAKIPAPVLDLAGKPLVTAAPAAETAEISADVKAQLKSLGYLKE